MPAEEPKQEVETMTGSKAGEAAIDKDTDRDVQAARRAVDIALLGIASVSSLTERKASDSTITASVGGKVQASEQGASVKMKRVVDAWAAGRKWAGDTCKKNGKAAQKRVVGHQFINKENKLSARIASSLAQLSLPALPLWQPPGGLKVSVPPSSLTTPFANGPGRVSPNYPYGGSPVASGFLPYVQEALHSSPLPPGSLSPELLSDLGYLQALQGMAPQQFERDMQVATEVMGALNMGVMPTAQNQVGASSAGFLQPHTCVPAVSSTPHLVHPTYSSMEPAGCTSMPVPLSGSPVSLMSWEDTTRTLRHVHLQVEGLLEHWKSIMVEQLRHVNGAGPCQQFVRLARETTLLLAVMEVVRSASEERALMPQEIQSSVRMLPVVVQNHLSEWHQLSASSRVMVEVMRIITKVLGSFSTTPLLPQVIEQQLMLLSGASLNGPSSLSGSHCGEGLADAGQRATALGVIRWLILKAEGTLMDLERVLKSSATTSAQQLSPHCPPLQFSAQWFPPSSEQSLQTSSQMSEFSTHSDLGLDLDLPHMQEAPSTTSSSSDVGIGPLLADEHLKGRTGSDTSEAGLMSWYLSSASGQLGSL